MMSVANRDEIEWPPTLSSYEQVQSELRAAIKTHPPFGDWLMQFCNANTVCGRPQSNGLPNYLHMSVPQLKEQYSKHAKQQALQAATTHAMAEEHLFVLRNSPGYKEACEEKLRGEETYKAAMKLYTNECGKIGSTALNSSSTHPAIIIATEVALDAVISKMTQAEAETFS